MRWRGGGDAYGVAFSPLPRPDGNLIDDSGSTGQQCLCAKGGTPPYKFFVIAGQLPCGQTLNQATGCIEGSPDGACPGSEQITFMVIDSMALQATVDCGFILPCAGGGGGGGSSATPSTDSMTPLNIAGIANGWILDSMIWRGAQPATESYPLLARAGCKSVMNLRPTEEMPWEGNLVEAAGMVYYDLGWNGIIPPSEFQVIDALSIIKASRANAAPVFVHCEHGHDRTGTLCACWRVSEYHWPAWKAEVEAMKYGEVEVWMSVAVSRFAKILHQ
jgi:protein-tyrosine phosphatase